MLNDTPVACQTREPTDPQGDRWHGEAVADEGPFVSCPARRQCPPNIPAASAATYPLRCFAPQWARFDNRHSISAPAPILSLHQRQRRRDSFAPRRERFLCLRRPHFFQQRKKWGKERRQKLRFCTSSARYTALVCKAAPPRNRHFLTRCRSADCASTAFRCRCLLLWQKLFVLPCRRLLYPVPNGHTYLCRLAAAKARFDNRHSTSAPTPTLTAVSGSGASGTSDP